MAEGLGFVLGLVFRFLGLSFPELLNAVLVPGIHLRRSANVLPVGLWGGLFNAQFATKSPRVKIGTKEKRNKSKRCHSGQPKAGLFN